MPAEYIYANAGSFTRCEVHTLIARPLPHPASIMLNFEHSKKRNENDLFSSPNTLATDPCARRLLQHPEIDVFDLTLPSYPEPSVPAPRGTVRFGSINSTYAAQS